MVCNHCQKRHGCIYTRPQLVWKGIFIKIDGKRFKKIGLLYREADKTWIFRLGRPDKTIDGPKAEKTWPGKSRKNNAGQKLKKQGRAKAEKTWPGKS